MNIGSKIKELRIQKSLTQEELADRAELSKGFISQLERDLTSPPSPRLLISFNASEPTLRNFSAEQPRSRSYSRNPITLRNMIPN